jgi:hypothetical protein
VTSKTKLRREAGHADIYARLGRITPGVGSRKAPVVQDDRIELDDIDMMAMPGGHRTPLSGQ